MDLLNNTLSIQAFFGDGSKLSLAIVGVVAVFVALGALLGFFRGFSRQVIRAITVAASFVGAYFITIKVNEKLVGLFNGRSVEEILDILKIKGIAESLGSPTYDIIVALEALTVEQLLTILLGAVIAPLIFVFLFVCFSLILIPVHKLLSGAFGFQKSKNNIVTRLMGLALGAVQGVVIGAIILFPVATIGSTYEDVVAEIGEPDSEIDEKIVSGYGNYLVRAARHPVITYINKYGGDTIAHNFAVFNIEGVNYDVRDSIPTVVDVASDIMSLSGINLADITPEQKAVIKSIPTKVGDDRFVASFIACTVRSVAHVFGTGVVPMDGIEPPFDSLIYTLVAILETTDESNVEADLNTIANVFILLSDSGVLTSVGQDAIDILIERDENSETLINLVIDEFNKNRHTQMLVTEITKVTINLMMASSSLTGTASGNDITADYETVKEGLNTVIAIDKSQYEGKEDEYYEAVSDSLNTTLAENGIELAPEIVDSMAQYIGDTYGDQDEITDEEFNDIMISYYDSYLDYLETGKLPDNFPGQGGFDGGDIPEGINPDDIPEGINPDDIPEGINPDDIPEGINPDDIPEGINPDDIPEGINPDDIPDTTP